MKTSHSVSSLLLRASSIIFAVGTLTAFVWYAQVRAKQPATVQAPEKSPIVLSGSKSYSGPVVSTSDEPLMMGSKSGILTQPNDQSDSIDGLIQAVQESKSRHPAASEAPKIQYSHPFPLRAPQVTLSSPIVFVHVSDLPEPKPALPETKAVGVPAAPQGAIPANQGKGQLMWGSKAPGGPLIGK